MNTKQLALVKLVFCGPNDVAKEINLAKEVVDNWNHSNSESRGLWVKHHHWLTDVYPDLAMRAQEIPNRQIIDAAKILVAIFWSRFGTPTGVADSGTQEEILRAVQQGKKVMVYFSDLEPKPADADVRQMESLWKFRQEIRHRGIFSNFRSKAEFRRMFENHLSLALNAFEPKPKSGKSARKAKAGINQKAQAKRGDIYQVVGDGNKFYKHPPKEKIVLERRPGSVTRQEEYQIGEWIKALAEGEVDNTREGAFGMWWSRFYKKFEVKKAEALESERMPSVKAWFQQQTAIQKRGLKRKDPQSFQNERIIAIKAAMREMGRTNEDYYPELSARLKMKKPIMHLPELTLRNLARVYNMVIADARRFRSQAG